MIRLQAAAFDLTVVVDEYGTLEGLATTADLLRAAIGQPTRGEEEAMGEPAARPPDPHRPPPPAPGG